MCYESKVGSIRRTTTGLYRNVRAGVKKSQKKGKVDLSRGKRIDIVKFRLFYVKTPVKKTLS